MTARLKTIRLELARTEGFPDGSSNHGYTFVAPLDGDGRIDAAAWQRHRGDCLVTRFWGRTPDEHGHLVHTAGRRWAFHYDLQTEPEEDEPGYRFGDHSFAVGEYVSITERDGVTRPFRVASVKDVAG